MQLPLLGSLLLLPFSARSCSTVAIKSLINVPVYMSRTFNLDSYHGTRSAAFPPADLMSAWYLNLHTRHAITAVPGTPAGFPEPNSGSRLPLFGFRLPTTSGPKAGRREPEA